MTGTNLDRCSASGDVHGGHATRAVSRPEKKEIKCRKIARSSLGPEDSDVEMRAEHQGADTAVISFVPNSETPG